MNHHLKLASADHKQEGQVLSQQLSQKNLRGLLASQQASSFKVLKQGHPVPTSDRPESTNPHDREALDSETATYLDGRGQPLPRDLNGALLALNALLDQSKMTPSARATGEKTMRMADGTLEKILAHQSNLLRAIEEHTRAADQQAAESRAKGAVSPLLKAHLRNLIHLTFKRKLFSLQLLLAEPREQASNRMAACMKISVNQARLFQHILERFCPWRSSSGREDTQSSLTNLSQQNERSQAEKQKQPSLTLAIVEYFAPYIQHLQPAYKDLKKREEAMACLMVLLKLLSGSEKLREAAVQKDIVAELFKMLPSLLASATRPTSPDFQQQLESSAFFICHFANMDADNKAKSATQRHLHHLQLTSSTRHNQMMLEQQHLQSHSYSQPQNKKVTPQQRKSGQHNHLGFNLNLQEVLAGPRLMTGDRYLESGGGLSGGPMSGPSGLGISGKTHGHHQNQQYSNLDTSGIRNHFYRNGPGTSSGGMYGGVAAGAPGTGHVNNSALPPMSTSQSRRFTQMTQQNAVSIGHTAGHHNKSLDGYRKRIQDTSQSPVRRLQGNSGANEFDGGDINTGESRQGVANGVPGLIGVGGVVGAQAEAPSGQAEGVGMQQQRQNIHRLTHINKQSFVRAASEPPHPGKSLNSKSIILPVQEENENRIDDDGPPSAVEGHEGSEEAGNGQIQNRRDQEAICKSDLKRDRDQEYDQNERGQDHNMGQQFMEFDSKHPSQLNRQVGHRDARRDENEDAPELGSAVPNGQRRDSSGFVMNSFLGAGGVQAPVGVGAPNGPPAHLSALSGQASQLSNLDNPLQENHHQMELQPPMAASSSAENADRVNLAYPALAQQNQQDVGKPSRRQLSYGQGQNEISRERTNKLQTASNQVIAAYGDPRDQRFTPSAPQAQPGQRPSNAGPPSGTGSQNKLDLPQNVSLSDEDSSEQHRDSGAESEGPSEQIQSENLDTVKDTQKPPSAASRSPLIPKLNLVQIKQDSMLGRHRIETSIGHQNILGTAGAPSLMATPGQHQNLNSVALVQAPAPLTSHYPVITSCSPDKRGGDQILYCMDTSNRTSAIIPIHVGAGGHPRILTSFTNAVGSNPHLISTESVNEFRMDHSGGHIGLPGGGLLSRGGAGGAQGRSWKHAANSGKVNKPAQSFKQQRNNMILKLKQFHTQHTQNNSDMNRGPGFEGEAEQKEHDQDHEQLSDPQLNALISEANATNVSAGGTTTNNNRSNSLKMLDGMASSTLNPFGGTQASNLVGMRDFDGAGGLGAGVGGAGGAILNMGGYNGLGSLYGAYGAYGAGVAGGALLVPSPEGQGCFQGDATRSVHDLGRQLGESYLAKDLASLLTQQRDMELQNEAEQAVLSQGQRWPEAKLMLGASKLEPATRSKSMIVSQEVLRSNRQSEWKTPVAAERAPASAFRPSFVGQPSRASPEEFLRTLALNILVLLLDAYPASQLRLLNSTMLLRGLLSFMQSNIFQLPVMQQAIDTVQQKQQLRWLLEQNAKSQPTNWLSSATKTIGAEQRGLIAVSFTQATDATNNDEVVAGRRSLSIHSEAEAGEIVMLDDPEAVLALLQKFQFANEDIMRRYVHSQFASFIDKQKPGLAVAVEQACRTEAGGQAFDLTSPQASQKKTQLENDKERKLQTLDEDSEEQFRLSRAQALKFQEQLMNGLKQHGLGMEDLLADPNLLVSNNGVTYDVTSAQAVPLASKGMCIPKEVIRRKLDIVLYVISKQIKNIIVKQAQEALCSANTPPPSAMGPMASSPDLNWLDPSFAQKLTKMLVVLSSYLEGQSHQSSRVLLSQVIDVVLEPLMMVKRLLADVVLRQKIFEHDPTRPIVAFVQQELIQKGLVVDDQLIIQEDNRSKSPPAGRNRNMPADQDPGQYPHQSQHPADASFHNQHHGLQAEVQMQIQFAANQMVFRHLFAEFLKLLRTILKLPQNCDSLKLLNEVFVGNSTWQSSVENYSKCLCHQDIVSPILVDLHRRHGHQLTVDQRCLIYENLEGLRGISFLNFDQKHFASQIHFIDSQAAIMLGHSIELRGICESQTQLLSSYLRETLRYHGAMMKFLKTALDIFFPHVQQQQRSNQQMKQAPNGLGGRGAPEKLHCSSFLNRMSHLNNPSRATMYQPNNNVSRGGIINTQTSRNVHQQMDSSFYSGMGGPNNPQQANHLGNSNARNLSPADFPYCQQSQGQNNKMDTTAAAPPAAQMSSENIFSMKSLSTEQKYWKHAVRRALNQISFWIHEESSSTSNLDTHGKALLNQYMDLNSTRYKSIKKFADDANSYVCPVNFCVTAAALDFLKHVFDLNEKFTKYMPIDEVLVVYARTHHTSFVRLYNQNKKHLNALQKISKTSSAAGRKDLGKEGPDSGRRDLLNVANKQAAGEEGSAEVLKLQLNYQNSLRLCKLHLKCLYALARTRTEDTRRKLHHFQLFSFLAQELNLENEYLAKRKKFLNISKRVAKEANEADSFEIEEVNSPTLASRRKGMGAGPQPRGFAVGPAGNDPTAEEGPQSFQREQGYILDPAKAYEAQDPNGTINKEIQRRIDDSLKMESQKAQAVEAGEAEDIGKEPNSSDSDLGLPPALPIQPPKPLKGFVPSLPISGLGISTLAMDGAGGKTAEQIADLQVLQDQRKARGEVVEDQLSESDSDTGLPPPPMTNPQSSLKMKLAIPNLKITGLGMSTLSKTANGLTAEQLADQELLSNAKLNAGSATKSNIGRRTSQAKQIMNQPNQLHDIRSETEIESFSNIQESVNSKKAASQKSATSTNIKMQQAGSENSESDSDDGLPPPIPQNKGTALSLPKLQIKGLGISTLANAENGGRTAEQEADYQILKEQKKVAVQKLQEQESESGASDSGSSDGLPPPLPAQKPQGFVMPKLAVGGLGLSTLAKDNGKTAEQEADEKMLKQQVAAKDGPATSHSRTSRSDSDDGLPPPVPVSRPNFALPKLQIGGLGLSTIAKTADGKTAEALADLELLKQSKAQQMKKVEESDSAQSNSSQEQPNGGITGQASSSDSDEGLPPALPPPRGPAKLGVPKLAIGGLGLSTVSNAQNGKTAEQMADLQLLQQQKQPAPGIKQKPDQEESSDSDSDLGLPPPIPVSSNASKFLPKLQIGGLGLSTLAKNEGGPTAEQMADMQVLNNAKMRKKSPDPSDSSATSRSLAQSAGQPRTSAANAGPVESESDSDLGLPPPLPPKPPGQVPGFKMPALTLGGLGLSTLKKDGENMTQEEMADAQQLQQQRAAAIQESEDEEDLSSDEQYYRELERIKAEGQASMSQNQSSQLEGGSRSDEEEDAEGREAIPQEMQQAAPQHFNTIDQHEPDKMFSQANSKVLSAKQSAEKGQMGAQMVQQPRHAESPGQNASLPQHPALAQNAKRTIKQKQIKINPIKLNIFGRGAGGPPAGNPEGHAKVPMKVINKAAAQKAATISNQGSGNLSQQLNIKQNQVKLLKMSHRNQAAMQNQSQQSAKRADDAEDPSSSRDPNQMTGELSCGAMRPPMPAGSENQHQDWNDRQVDDFLEARKPAPPLGVTASDQKPLRPQRPLVDESLLIKATKSTNDPQNHGRNAKNVNFANQQSTNPGGDNLKMIFETDEAILETNLRKKNDNVNRHLSSNFSDLKEEPKLPQEWSRSFSIHEQQPQTFLPRGQLQKTKTFKSKKKRAIRISKDDFYSIEREKRPLYHDEELHRLMLSLILCLLLQPQRGTLDDLYCHQYPINNGKQNYLYILHQHIAYEKNQYVIEGLLSEMNRISPPLAGQRLLKLMCPQLFDLKLYNNGKEWKKLAEGAYGTVYECKTNLIQPKSVAIKQMGLPSDIFDRCVLHDIFTEITCLEEFRLEKCVTDLYDYGVDSQSYYIVMKKYTCSLGEWRRRQGNSIEVFQKNLRLYVSIYNKVLKSLRTIHSHNVTHYDIKCDNVLISFIGDEDDADDGTERPGATNRTKKARDLSNLTDEDFEITIGDFGECKIFSNDKDEFCTRNRGTDCIKSPEMLQLTIHTRKDHDKYDRRKQVGTNRLSDIWSVGCLFYELCTGEFLLYEPDVAYFYVRVVQHQQELITKEKLEKIDCNQYIKDFLKFILIRDQRLRPTIDKVIKRFELIHAIVCNLSEADLPNERGNSQAPHALHNNGGFPQLPASMVIKSNTELQECLHKASWITQTNRLVAHQKNTAPQEQTRLTRILEGVFMCSAGYIKERGNIGAALHSGITHVVISRSAVVQSLRNKFELLEIDTVADDETLNPFKSTPVLMDFLRRVTLYKGRVLFVENRDDNFIKECLLIAFAHIFKTNIFETYTLVKSQSLFFKIEASRLGVISEWNMQAQKIRQYLTTFPQFSCHCGASLIILERSFAQYQNMQRIVSCNCPQKVNKLDKSSFLHLPDVSEMEASPKNGYQTCPCAASLYVSCSEHLEFLDRYYFAGRGSNGTHITQSPLNTQQSQLLWAYLDAQDFVLCPDAHQAHMAQEKPDPTTKSLESRRSQASSSRKSRPIPKVPAIPIGQAISHQKGRSGPAGPGSNAGMSYGHQPPTLADNQTPSNRGQAPRFSKYERHIVSNLSQSLQVNGVPVVTPEKVKAFWAHVKELRLAYVQRLQQMEAQQAAASPDGTPSPALVGGAPHGLAALRNGRGLASGTSLLSNTPEPNSSRQLKNLISRGVHNVGNQAVPPGQPSSSEQYEMHAHMMAALQETPKGAKAPGPGDGWDIRKCSICHCWTHAYHAGFNKYAVLLNNRINSHNHGLLSQWTGASGQQGASTGGSGALSGLGMTSNLEQLERQFLLVREEYLKRLQLVEEQQLQLQNFNGGTASASRAAPGPLLGPLPLRSAADRVGGSMFSNFQKNTPAARPSADRVGMESFTYGINESVMLSSSVGVNRISSNRGRHITSLALGRTEDPAYGPSGTTGAGTHEGVRVPVLEHLGIQLPF